MCFKKRVTATCINYFKNKKGFYKYIAALFRSHVNWCPFPKKNPQMSNFNSPHKHISQFTQDTSTSFEQSHMKRVFGSDATQCLNLVE